MAHSKVGGAFGFLRKSIGSIVYSTSTASLSGIKKQVARSKPTSVRNPRTISQIVQRMKVGPAQLFYAAFEKVAGSVENNPLSHSWQGVPYGPKSRTKFLQLAMTGDPKAYVPKGISFPVPGVYQVSEGSLPNMPGGVHSDSENQLIAVGGSITQSGLEALVNMGVQAGDQITCVALFDNGGKYEPGIARVIVGFNNPWEALAGAGSISGIALYDDGIEFSSADGEVACAAFILSRGTSSSTAKRSTAFMTIAPNYANLMSPEAYNAAIDSYITGTLYNTLNSDWYLNQGGSQAFNGEIFTLNVPLVDDASVSAPVLLGRRLNGGSLEYVVFYNQVNQGTKNPFKIENGNLVPTPTIALGTVIETLGSVSYVEQATTQAQAEAYYQQMTLQGKNA